jgi:hypothetical protein
VACRHILVPRSARVEGVGLLEAALPTRSITVLDMLAATLGYSLVFGVLNGLWWVMVLRGPYWLYRRRGHRDAGKFWTPWGLTIAGVIAVISTLVTLAGNY